VIAITVGAIGVFRVEHLGFGEALLRAVDLPPWVLVPLALAPAVGALIWAEAIESRGKRRGGDRALPVSAVASPRRSA
jgi:hypothetical protein